MKTKRDEKICIKSEFDVNREYKKYRMRKLYFTMSYHNESYV